MTASKRCNRCGLKKRLTQFYRNASRKDGLSYHCRVCSHEIKETYKKDGVVKSSAQSQRRARFAVLCHYSDSAKPFCACCHEHRLAFLAIDHIGGGGNKHREEIGRRTIYAWLKTNGYPSGFRVLCSNCNNAIGAYGICPHETERRGQPEPGLPSKTRTEILADQMQAASENLVKHGVYPSLRAIAVEIGNSSKSVGNLCILRRRLVEQGRWACDVMPRGSYKRKTSATKMVRLSDGTERELLMDHPGIKVTQEKS